MNFKIMQKLTDLLSSRNRRTSLIKMIIFLIVILPIIFITVMDYISTRNNLTELTLARRESIARLGTIVLEGKYDRLIDICVSLSGRAQFNDFVKQKRWVDAINLLSDVPGKFDFIELVYISDASGILKSEIPTLPAGSRGKDFSYRDWYIGAVKTGKPYISQIYKRDAEPPYNVISVTMPIYDENKILLGVLGMQVKLDTILEWGKEVDVGTGGYIYFVDKYGAVAGHPLYPSQGEIINFSNKSYVKKALAGETGIETVKDKQDNIEQIVSYAPVANYGWGVIVEQPNPPAFALRDSSLSQRIILNSVALLITILLIYFLISFAVVLNDYRQKEQVFLESIGDGLVAIDRDLKIMLWNKAASVITGWKKEEVMGKPMQEILRFIRENDRREGWHFIEEVIVTGKAQKMESGTSLIRKDNSLISVGDSAAPVFDRTGRVGGVIIVFRDESQERENQRLRSDFSYASHQLRTPVNKALWTLEAGMKKENVDELKDAITVSYKSIKSMGRLSEELLEVSRIDQKEVVVEKSEVKLAEAFEKAIKSVSENAASNKITVNPPKIPISASINTDQKMLEAIVKEVLYNSIIYNKPGGTVDMNTELKDKEFIIKIEDSGIGITDEDKPSIFNKFFRGANVNTTDIAGAGLGLYIVKEYIKLLGGRIWFQPKDKGTIFYIGLPVD